MVETIHTKFKPGDEMKYIAGIITENAPQNVLIIEGLLHNTLSFEIYLKDPNVQQFIVLDKFSETDKITVYGEHRRGDFSKFPNELLDRWPPFDYIAYNCTGGYEDLMQAYLNFPYSLAPNGKIIFYNANNSPDFSRAIKAMSKMNMGMFNISSLGNIMAIVKTI